VADQLGTDLDGIRRALVVGLGASGRAATRLLSRVGVEVTVVEDEPARRLPVDGAQLHDGTSGDVDPSGFDLVVPSPGVPEHAPLLRRAASAAVRTWSEPEVAWRVRPSTLVGVTGTNGKTTVTALIADMLGAGGIDAVACGNIGLPMADVIADHGDAPMPVLVVELSSFQLRFAHRLAPAVGVILNIAPDHLDWHGSFEAYRDAKARLLRNAGPQTVAVAGDDDNARAVVAAAGGRHVEASSTGRVDAGVGVDAETLVAWPDGVPLVGVGELPSAAPHVVANAAAAAAAALAAGAANDAVAGALQSWQIGPHRLAVVALDGGVTWVDDSKATNVHAAIAALGSADSIVWIGGGQAKGTDLTVLGAHLGSVRHAVLLGESAQQLAAVCSASTVPFSRAGTMQQAVSMAAAEARPGDTVLLSPAGASFDLFDGYADRGDQFAAAVRQLVNARGGRL